MITISGRTARTILTNHEGSRTWLIARSLRALGIATDIVVAENERGYVDIMRVLQDGLGDPKYRPCPLLIKMVDAGWLGKKSGRGFYKY